MIKKFIFASLNVDESILNDTNSKKEHNLIYGLFASVILSTLVVFGITLYACSVVPDLEGFYAWLIATIVAIIIFRFDCAIIGSEWDRSQNHQSEILQTYAIPAIFWGFINFVLKVVRLSPRIAFSIVIAVFIATIAELAIQKDTIQTVLTDRANQYNEETGNKDRRDELTDKHKDSVARLNTRKETLETSIEARGKINFNQRLELLQSDSERLTNVKAELQATIKTLTDEKLKREENLLLDETEFATLESEIAELQRLMDEEVNDPDKCRNVGAEKCRGPEWERYRDNLRQAEDKLSKIVISAERTALNTLNDTILTQEALLNTNRADLEAVNKELDAVGDNSGKTPEQLESELTKIKTEIADQEQKNTDELRKFDEEEKDRGQYRNPNEYDFLLLYSGLEELHNDPQRGAGAVKFSWGLFRFIVLMELSAVISALFFLPYSIYASKAYVDVKERQLDEEIEMSKFKDKRQNELYMSTGLGRNIKKATKAIHEGQLDGEPNPTPPPQKE